jgi:hypothetical protein
MLRSRIVRLVLEIWLRLKFPTEMSSPVESPQAGDRYKSTKGSPADIGHYTIVWAVRDDYLVVSQSSHLDPNSLEVVSMSGWIELAKDRRYKPYTRLRGYGAGFWDVANCAELPDRFGEVSVVEYAETWNSHPVSSIGTRDSRRRTFGNLQVKVPVFVVPRRRVKSVSIGVNFTDSPLCGDYFHVSSLQQTGRIIS